jgi:histidinol-phosphate aminotransferase
VWLPLGAETVDFATQATEQARVLVRPYGNEGARVSIGAAEENDAFLTFAGSWIRR